MKNQNQQQDTAPFPKVYGSKSKSVFGTAGLYTVDGGYNPFDATAPGMDAAKALARAEYAAKAVNEHDALVAVAEAAEAILRVIEGPRFTDRAGWGPMLRQHLDRLAAIRAQQ